MRIKFNPALLIIPILLTFGCSQNRGGKCASPESIKSIKNIFIEQVIGNDSLMPNEIKQISDAIDVTIELPMYQGFDKETGKISCSGDFRYQIINKIGNYENIPLSGKSNIEYFFQKSADGKGEAVFVKGIEQLAKVVRGSLILTSFFQSQFKNQIEPLEKPENSEKTNAPEQSKSTDVITKKATNLSCNSANNLDELYNYGDVSNIDFNRNNESIPSLLCKKEFKSVSESIEAGDISRADVIKLSEALGIKYNPPEQSAKGREVSRYLSNISQYLPEAADGTVAYAMVYKPNSECAMFGRQLYSGNKLAISKAESDQIPDDCY